MAQAAVSHRTHMPGTCITGADVYFIVQVLDAPPELRRGRQGPVVSAMDIDLQLLWRRLQQIAEIHRRMRETVQVQT